ncbi:acyltransferase family protein [Oryzobacter telluris]|uniref:acyltransferase family protein n=1 Tax=Oryzobacter telluris TaxID=3149179 RepID=UPI00370DDD6E
MATAEQAAARPETQEPAAPRETTRPKSFRPDIEGLRAVAILTVLAHHAGLPLHGGYIGVDIFFVISGYLITGLLVNELWSTGRISWLRFVGRRIRRLLPAAILVLTVTSAVAFVVVPGLRRRDIGVDIMAAAGYVVNWVFAGREVDYLASDLKPSPVQHFWSLAVEEQFYVVWPLLLIALALVVRKPGRRAVLTALSVLVAGSFAWSVWYSHTDYRPAFFTTTTRIWELGVGALLAVALAGRARPDVARRWAAPVGWVALVVLLAVAALLRGGIEWPSYWALLPTVPTAILLWVGWQGAANGPVRVLGSRPMVWVGGLSYSIYLWHWPIIILGEWTAEWLGHPLTAPGKVVLAVLAVGPAWLSWRFVESPIHHGPWLRERPRALLAAGVALSLTGVLVALPLLPLRSPFDTTPPGGAMPPVSQLGANTVRLGQPLAGIDDPGWVTPDPMTSGEDRPAADVDHCQVDVSATAPVACTFGDPRGTTTVALVGDSKAMQWLPALEEAARTSGWRILTYGKSSCAFSDAPATQASKAYPECDTWNAAVMEALQADPPDALVTSGVASAAWVDGRLDRRALVEGYTGRWRSLADAGVPVVVVGDSPLSPDDLDICAARHPHELTRCAFEGIPAIKGSGLTVQREAAAAAGPGVALLDLTAWICPEERCPVVIGHVAVHRAGDHVTATYAATLAPQVGAAVEDALRRFG